MSATSDFIDVEEEYEKDKKLRREDVQQLQEWAFKQPHLPKIPERQMIFFLHSCFYSNEAAKTCIEMYYTIRAHSPEFFTNRDLRQGRNYVEILGGLTYMPLPKLTPEGNKIICCRLVDPNPDTFVFSSMVKSLDMTNSLILNQQGTFNGIIIVADFWAVTMTHVAKFNLLQLKKFFLYFQEAMPVRISSLHIINISSIADKFVTLLKQFMKKEVFSNLHVYTKIDEGFFKFVPIDCLPSDYGGPLEPVERLRKEWCENMMAHADVFVQEESAVADESRRLGKRKSSKDIFGVEGSFKKLDFD